MRTEQYPADGSVTMMDVLARDPYTSAFLVVVIVVLALVAAWVFIKLVAHYIGEELRKK